MEPLWLTIVLVGAFIGGFVNGLTGFGTAMTSLPIWSHVLAPTVAAPLVAACSAASQLQTLPAIWHAMEWRRVLPFVIPGLVGVPIGVLILPRIDIPTFKVIVGSLLILACAFLLLYRGRQAWSGGGRLADAGIGFAGGVLGGLAALSGMLPTLWAELRGWEKDARRAVFQGYNLSILSFAFVSHMGNGLFTRELGFLLLICIPTALAGAWAGQRVYRRMHTRHFSRMVLVVLIFAGASLLYSGLRGA